jgi:hypothetical protein
MKGFKTHKNRTSVAPARGAPQITTEELLEAERAQRREYSRRKRAALRAEKARLELDNE